MTSAAQPSTSASDAKTTPPAEDIAAVETAATFALSLYEKGSELQPFSIVMTGDQSIIVPAEDMSTPEAKREYADILRHVSLKHGGMRTAFAFEAWTLLSAEPAAIALMEEIKERGGSLGEHPDAGEAVIVIVESDAGTTMRTHRIVRTGDDVALEPAIDDFNAADGDSRPSGILTGFHIPTDRREEPPVRLFALMMDMRYDGEIEPLGGDDADAAESVTAD